MAFISLRARNNGWLTAVNLDLVAEVHAEYDADDATVKVPSDVFLCLRLHGESHLIRYVPVDNDGREYPSETDAANAVRNFTIAANRLQRA